MISDFFLLAAFAGSIFLTISTVWAHRDSWVRAASVIICVCMIPALVGSSFFSLSYPAPLRKYMLSYPAPLRKYIMPSGKHEVIAVHMRQDFALWIWLATVDGPRYYVLPWNKRMARQLHETRREARRKGSKVMMRLPFKTQRDDGPRMFYAPPQPPLPPKQAARQDPLIR